MAILIAVIVLWAVLAGASIKSLLDMEKKQQKIRVKWHYISQEAQYPTCRRCSPEQARTAINGRE